MEEEQHRGGEETAKHRVLGLQLLTQMISDLGAPYGLFVLAVISFGLLTLLPAQLFRYFTESLHSFDPNKVAQFAFSLSLFGLLVGIALLISNCGNILCQEWLRLAVESRLRRRVLKCLHVIPLASFDGSQRGDWLTRMTADLSRVELFLTESIPSQLRNSAIVVGSGVLFFVYSGTLAFLPLLTAIVFVLFNLWAQTKLAPTLLELRRLHGGIFQMLIESFEGIRTVRSHSAERYIERRFDINLGEITSKSLRVVRMLGAVIGGTSFASQLMITFCLVGATFALTGSTLTLEEILVYPFFLGLFYSSAQSLAASSYDWNRYFNEAGRLAELLAIEQWNPSIHRHTCHGLQNINSLWVKDLVIGHKGRVLADGMAVNVRRGELLAILGPSGCGKSTFLEVMAGLRPGMAGSFQLADKEGRPIWHNIGDPIQFPLGYAAYVEQAPYIFEGTLRENLLLGNPSRLSNTILWEELVRCGLQSFVKLNGGLEYKLNDRGRNLSEGERYRIAICRALLLSRPFLFLDEPFAALDVKNAYLVTRIVLQEKRVRGVVVVTHSFPASMPVDRVLTFEPQPGKPAAVKTTLERVAVIPRHQTKQTRKEGVLQ